MRVALVTNREGWSRTFTLILQRELDGAVVWHAETSSEAVLKCLENRPDLILVDLMMPKMAGMVTIRDIMKQCPCPMLALCESEKDHSLIYEALGHGARDFALLPGSDHTEIAALIRKLKSAASVKTQEGACCKIPASMKDVPDRPILVAIGASTGGPEAVKAVLSCLPGNFPGAIVIVQHVDVRHASGMADWLNKDIPLPVRIACEGDHPFPGTVLFAATNDHLVMMPEGRLSYTRHPVDYAYRPSVDEFFASIALYCRSEMIAVLLTGMGRDGGRGLLALRRLGHYTIAQDKESSIVYGMPKDAAERGAAMEVLSPPQIGKRLTELTAGGNRPTGRGWK